MPPPPPPNAMALSSRCRNMLKRSGRDQREVVESSSTVNIWLSSWLRFIYVFLLFRSVQILWTGLDTSTAGIISKSLASNATLLHIEMCEQTMEINVSLPLCSNTAMLMSHANYLGEGSWTEQSLSKPLWSLFLGASRWRFFFTCPFTGCNFLLISFLSMTHPLAI